MISEFIIDLLFSILSGLLSILPDISWSVEIGRAHV